MFHPACRWTIAWLTLLLAAAAAQAQSLTGPWVQQQDHRIEEHRKGNIRIIVLDGQGKAVPNAQVHLAMQRHDFPFGVRLDAGSFKDEEPTGHQQRIWPLLNSIAIEELAERVQLDARQQDPAWEQIDAMLRWSRQRGLSVRWGSTASSDLSRLPAWVPQETNQKLVDALENHIDQLAGRVGGSISQWDVLTGLPDQTYLQQRLGQGIVRRLFAQAQARSPHTPRLIRFNDTLAGPRLTQMVQTLGELRDAQVPLTGVAMDFKLGGNVAYVSLERSMEWIGRLGLPVSVVNLEVGGPTPSAAAINLETTLRTLFSYPFIQGVWFNGIAADQVIDPSSAFIDDMQIITPPGELLQRLVGKLWWTDEILTADNLGNVRHRAFAGAYRIHAAWPGGQAQTAAYLRPGKHTQLVIVQQLTPDAATTGDPP